jgi:hypothetical protein
MHRPPLKPTLRRRDNAPELQAELQTELHLLMCYHNVHVWVVNKTQHNIALDIQQSTPLLLY